MLKKIVYPIVVSFLIACAAVHGSEEETLKDVETFLAEAFVDAAPARKVLWVNDELREEVRQFIGYDLDQLRIRYWAAGSRTAWILEEIGKERPITMGIVVNGDEISNVSILVYRESRGAEVQYDFFTKQFLKANLVKNTKRYELSESIDGITGATLSVRAVKKVATLALFLHQQTPYALNG
ncbi:FMN-binding protein [Saccharophagus degradans]|uniref:FMN-binding protein n=1 Tax=Saccharophagus degradans TaxID=86304 RepID=A0AAW7XC37_9GAMM|nr:FMN-binding protein [Saccharophagus degradans]MDO6424501.1 FMN-binding protein [Saccharophagus degradans]MDO6608876.1 FMN-binding protein [Saccharophagus degradans]